MPTTTPPPSPCTCGRLRRAARTLTQLYDDEMAPTGLRITQFSLLRTLERNGPATLSALAAAALLDRTALSRTLDPLVARGLVAIVPGNDARTRRASLTATGSAALRAAQPHWARAQRAVAARLGDAKIRTLLATLAEIESLHPATPA